MGSRNTWVESRTKPNFLMLAKVEGRPKGHFFFGTMRFFTHPNPLPGVSAATKRFANIDCYLEYMTSTGFFETMRLTEKSEFEFFTIFSFLMLSVKENSSQSLGGNLFVNFRSYGTDKLFKDCGEDGIFSSVRLFFNRTFFWLKCTPSLSQLFWLHSKFGFFGFELGKTGFCFESCVCPSGYFLAL